MKREAPVKPLVDRIIDVFAFLCGATFILMMLSVSTDVCLRSFLNSPITGILELNEYALLYATFLGTAWVLRAERHVTVDMAVNQLKPRARALTEFITSVLGAVATGVLTWFSALATLDHLVRGAVNPGAVLRIPTAFIIGIIPVGSLLLLIQFVRRSDGFFRQWRASRRE